MRCDIHPPLFPYLVTRRFATVFIQDPFLGQLSEPQLRAIAARRAQEFGYHTAVVFGHDRAVFFGSDGKVCESASPPSGGVLIIRTDLGDLEQVDLSEDRQGGVSSGRRVEDDPTRMLARDLFTWLRDRRGLNCSLVATTRDPDGRGILLVLDHSDSAVSLMLEVELKDAVPEEFQVLVW